MQFLQGLLFDPTAIVVAVGYIGICIIIFSETGILLGVFLPGDSLLFAAGLVASQGMFNPIALSALVALSAIIGDASGYWIGRKGGEIILHRYPHFIKPEHIARTEQFYERWGARAIVLARFVPIVRTIVPVLAGIARMRYDRFSLFNMLGGVLWAPIMIYLGYFLGRSVPDAAHYLLPISIGIIVLSFAPLFIRIARGARPAREL